ncbi:MAG: hypothetical protein HY756_07070 [Nitrospirae bacterium]|nr:hypothetical protein [Nitrospirota bacterium]
MIKNMSLTSKFIVISLIILVFLGIFWYTGSQFTAHIRDEATRMNLSGQLRYRQFEMAWLVNAIADAENPGERNALVSELKHEIGVNGVSP